MKVSVIIPVKNDAPRLRLCLGALARQTLPADAFEVIVVDNGSGDRPELLARDYPSVRFALEAKPGASAARNKGLSFVTGEAVAFTDADCIPNPEWLEEGLRALARHERGGLTAGRVEVFPPHGGPPSAVELFDMAHAFDQRLFVERWHFGATANLFVSRRTAEAVGGFNDTIPYYGEDVDFGQRAWCAGWPISYGEQAVVRHPARSDWASLHDRHRRIVRAACPEGGGSLRRLLLDLMHDWPDFKTIADSWRHPSASRPGQGLRLAAVSLWVRLVRTGFRLDLFARGTGGRRR
jgi:glycosyltransferase involved in cell wall biosynthesis